MGKHVSRAKAVAAIAGLLAAIPAIAAAAASAVANGHDLARALERADLLGSGWVANAGQWDDAAAFGCDVRRQHVDPPRRNDRSPIAWAAERRRGRRTVE